MDRACKKKFRYFGRCNLLEDRYKVVQTGIKKLCRSYCFLHRDGKSQRTFFLYNYDSYILYNNNIYARILVLFTLMIIPTSLWNTITEFI